MKNITETQIKVINEMKEGAIINYFRGIGTRYRPSADLETIDGKHISPVSVATVKALRDKNLLEQFDRESYHSKYRLKTTETANQ